MSGIIHSNVESIIYDNKNNNLIYFLNGNSTYMSYWKPKKILGVLEDIVDHADKSARHIEKGMVRNQEVYSRNLKSAGKTYANAVKARMDKVIPNFSNYIIMVEHEEDKSILEDALTTLEERHLKRKTAYLSSVGMLGLLLPPLIGGYAGWEWLSNGSRSAASVGVLLGFMWGGFSSLFWGDKLVSKQKEISSRLSAKYGRIKVELFNKT
jgi:ribosomal protein S20